MANEESLQLAVLQYIDATGLLNDVISQCETNVQQGQWLHRYIIPINPGELMDIEVDLGELVLHDIQKAANIFQQVVFVGLKALGKLPDEMTIGQVWIILRLLSVPSLPRYNLSSYNYIDVKRSGKRMISIGGVVTGKSLPVKYTQSARFLCPQADCQGSEGHEYIRTHCPAASELHVIRQPFKCRHCSSDLIEDNSCRIISEKVLIEVVSADALYFAKEWTKTFSQTTPIYVRDDLISNVHIGEMVQIFGVAFIDHVCITRSCMAIEANNIIHYSSPPRALSAEGLPKPFQVLLHDRRTSPWSFGLTVAFLFGEQVSPLGTYNRLKLGLLLSLITSKSNYQPENSTNYIDVLAVATEVDVVNRLMLFAASFGEQSMLHRAGSRELLGSTSVQNRHGVKMPMVTGGSSLLCGKGICVVGDITTLPKQESRELQGVLESRNVSLRLPSSSNAESDVTAVSASTFIQPSNCSFWSIAMPGGLSDRLSSKSSTNGADYCINVPSIAESFSTVYVADDTNSSVLPLFTQHCLSMAGLERVMQETHFVSRQDHLRTTRNDYVVLLDMVSSLSAEVLKEAQTLISRYYTASRQIRKDRFFTRIDAIAPVAKTLLCLAESFAKLNLRTQVTKADALQAILIYEEYQVSRTGYSALGVLPKIHCTSSEDVDTLLGATNDKAMEDFEKVLATFCNTYCPFADARSFEDMSFGINEE